MAAVVSSFRDGCSCRVWAIDGWQTEAIAAAMNVSFQNWGTNYDQAQQLNRAQRLQAIDNLSATQTIAAQATIICGYFQNAVDPLPDHMWLIHGNFIYDTMPGWPLVRKPLPAGPAGRRSPGCVNGVYPHAKVVSIASLLTVYQQNVLNAAAFTLHHAGVALNPGTLAYMPP
ncbi:hypothetical protein [Dyella sp.]|uniref:hypothetical protein n=1 Tax=Dyella sp. TaxID=1869338 RepID=UPI00284FA8C5|nr:hypothetical protein [Dyella sp.]MDR3445409.1 hypothetical protein [Dyella sp.]